MNLKISLKKILTLLKNKNARYYWEACRWGYCPNDKETENDDVRQLSKRLKGFSLKETLTNILEWQHRNIGFWDERHPVSVIFLGSFLCLIFSLVLVPLFLIFRFNYFWVISLFSGSAATAFIVLEMMFHSNRIKTKEGLLNALFPNISLNMLVVRERKFGVCRDYAKLTACLLQNAEIKEVYFFHSASHVATGAKVEKEMFVIDQHLPLLTINQWCKREFGSDDESKIPLLYRKVEKLQNGHIELIPIRLFLSKEKMKKPNENELSLKFSGLLNIEERPVFADAIAVENLLWEKGADLYNNNEIIDYSLARLLKIKISNDIVETNQITKLRLILKENGNMNYKITFKQTSSAF
jgi:predicted transglutaminase-like protease